MPPVNNDVHELRDVDVESILERWPDVRHNTQPASEQHDCLADTAVSGDVSSTSPADTGVEQTKSN